MSLGNTIIIGSGLLGNQLYLLLKNQGINCRILNHISYKEKNLIPDNTESIIFVAQSKEYRSIVMTEDLLYVNTILPSQILSNAYNIGVKNVAICSSGSVYGFSQKEHEEDEIINFDDFNPYAASKFASEVILHSWKKNFKKTLIFRPFFMYGYGQKEEMLFSKMVFNVKNHQSIKLANNIGLIFNPVHVLDAARFIQLALENGKDFDIYNIAGQEQVSLKDIVVRISNILNEVPNIEYVNEKEKYLLGSIKKMRDLGFRYKINLDAGLNELILNKKDDIFN